MLDKSFSYIIKMIFFKIYFYFLNNNQSNNLNIFVFIKIIFFIKFYMNQITHLYINRTTSRMHEI